MNPARCWNCSFISQQKTFTKKCQKEFLGYEETFMSMHIHENNAILISDTSKTCLQAYKLNNAKYDTVCCDTNTYYVGID